MTELSSKLHCMKETDFINACLTEGKCTDNNSRFCFSVRSVTKQKYPCNF